MKNYCTRLDKLFIPACIVVYLIVVFKVYRFDLSPYLWYDEVGQFWIAKGLNHDSDPLSLVGSVVDVVRNNHDYNLDPGGFGLLLHFWSMINNGYVWLRTLPFLFFIGTILLFIHLSYRWTKNKYIAVLMGFIPVFTNMIMREMFNIRAYSMEIMGVVVAVVAMDYIKEKVTLKRLLVFSLLISLFMTSRYSYIIVAFVSSTYILWLIYKTNESNKKKLLMAELYALPLLVTLTCIYFMAFRYQNPGLEKLHYLDYISSKPSLLLKNSSLLLFFKLGLIVWLCWKIKDTPLYGKYFGLAYVTIATNLIFLALSAFGKHPWGAIESRCVSMATLVFVSTMAFWCEVLNYVEQRTDIRYAVLIFFIFQYINPQYIRPLLKSSNTLSDTNVTNVLLELQSLPYNENTRFYVDRWNSPSIRYLFEYGEMQGLYHYPDNFVFTKGQKHCIKNGESKAHSKADFYKTQPYMNELMDYDILIADELYTFKPDNSDKWEPLNDNKDNSIWIKKEANE